ncbi:hypothetical protein BIY29_03800 [Brenneria alni]|uniref:Uncharacterized protein n=2 Tax=Brenneria alni TaxID=71656 RepID=A0A421DRZ3_9GAMM|nr:hypothetical protein BIY29_03800 [Brenneria alni]
MLFFIPTSGMAVIMDLFGMEDKTFIWPLLPSVECLAGFAALRIQEEKGVEDCQPDTYRLSINEIYGWLTNRLPATRII